MTTVVAVTVISEVEGKAASVKPDRGGFGGGRQDRGRDRTGAHDNIWQIKQTIAIAHNSVTLNQGEEDETPRF